MRVPGAPRDLAAMAPALPASLDLLDGPALDDLDWSALLSDADGLEAAALSPDATDSSSDSSCQDACARRRERRAANARRRRAQFKTTTDTLRAEAHALEAQLVALRGQRATTHWHERAAVQKRKRSQAEAENRQLKLALAALRTRVHDLGAFLSDGFLNTSVNLRDLLHTYSHLTRDASGRASDFLDICSQQKLDLALQIVTREARKLRAPSPQLLVQRVESRPEEFAVSMTARTVLDTSDLALAFSVAGRAHMACNVGWANFRQLGTSARAKEVPTHDIRYAVGEAQYASASTGEIVLLEDYSLTYWKLSPSCGVIVWDFVDVDELYPPREPADVRRLTTSALVVHREFCDDGVERVVCSTLCTKILEFLPGSKPVVSRDTVGSAATIVSDMQMASRLVQQMILTNMLLPSSGTGLD